MLRPRPTGMPPANVNIRPLPAETDVVFLAICGGTLVCPAEFDPQPTTVPSSRRASRCREPAAISLTRLEKTGGCRKEPDPVRSPVESPSSSTKMYVFERSEAAMSLTAPVFIIRPKKSFPSGCVHASPQFTVNDSAQLATKSRKISTHSRNEEVATS